MATAVRKKQPEGVDYGRVTEAVTRACRALLADQHPDGHWCYELEADCTIPAEYVLFLRYLGESRPELEAKIGNYLRSRQAEHGGWPLYLGGDLNMSCTVKAYYALKLIGDDPEAPHMVRAREAVLSRGGAARCNVFTRIALAIFDQVPWRAVPFIPPEIMLLPRWFFFHIIKVSYWSRTVMVPLFVVYAHKARAANPGRVGVRELFTRDPFEERDYFPVRSFLNRLILMVERSVRPLEPLIPGWIRRKALKRAEAWFVPRCNEGGLGAIFPAMINAFMALDLLGHDPGEPLMKQTRKAIDDLLVVEGDTAYCQPCVSPVWDTGLACLALLEDGADDNRQELAKALDWLSLLQLLNDPGDWRINHPDLGGGGWGETNDSYLDPARSNAGDRSTAFQTAWALLGLMAAAEGDSDEVRRGVDFLIENQDASGGWSDPEFTAPGFPRVFYLRYHGYSMFFPLWALARYRNHVTAR